MLLYFDPGQRQIQLRLAGPQLHSLLVGRQGLRQATVLEQDLAAQLVIVGILRLFGDQAVDQLERARQLGAPEVHDRPGVARLGRDIAFGIGTEHLSLRLEEADELGPHALVQANEFRMRRCVGVRRALQLLFQEADPLAGQGVGPQIGILRGCQEDLLAAKDTEEGEQPAGRLLRGFQEPDRRLVGRLLLTPRIRKQAFQRQVLTT